MITINNVQLLNGEVTDLELPSEQHDQLDATGLTAFPGLIDPHVHFRTPGQEYKEDWRTAAQATVRGGYTTVFDMPNNLPPCVTQDRLADKKALINAQLEEAGIPLRYELYLGADKHHFQEIHQVCDQVVGIKVFMGSSTGELLMDDESSLHAVFAIAAKFNMLVALHAEDEAMIQQRQGQFQAITSHQVHSQIRTPEVAAKAVAKVIELVRLYGTKVYILHVSSINELALIKQAKEERLPVYAETSPHHLFLNTEYYEKLGGRAQMNPPLRSPEHQAALFEAIHEGVIDTVGSDHAPHTTQEKDQPYGQSPSGVPGIETNLPLLLNAYHEKLLTLTEIANLTCFNIRKMTGLKETDDLVLVDLNKVKTVTNDMLATKCHWSPFAGWKLQGWPVYTIMKNQLYDLSKGEFEINLNKR